MAVETQVRETCLRLNMLQLALNTTSLPLIVADSELRGRNVNLTVVKDLVTSPLGMNLTPPFSGEEGARYIERSGTGLQELLDYVRLLLGQLQGRGEGGLGLRFHHSLSWFPLHHSLSEFSWKHLESIANQMRAHQLQHQRSQLQHQRREKPLKNPWK